MKILVLGSGGREHALVWKLSHSPEVDKIFCIPGNAGISSLAHCVEIKDTERILNFAKENKIDITLVGPEAPLVNGIVDRFEKENLKIFGPNKEAAMIEGSKVFAKLFMEKHGIPTANFRVFESPNAAEKYFLSTDFPIVIKADGLAAGKGAFVVKNRDEAFEVIDKVMRQKLFGDSGDRIIVERFLKGREVSALAFCDGKSIVPMVSSMDYKKAYDSDLGPNTGGMGAIAPAPHYTKDIASITVRNIFLNVIEGLQREGISYKGVLYAGLMITENGPKVLEFNCRFGDPETQVILPLLKTDLSHVVQAIIEGELAHCPVEWFDSVSLCVVAVSQGYPLKYRKGFKILGLDEIDDDVMVFHAGTKRTDQGIVTNGGRVLSVCATDSHFSKARARVYRSLKKIRFEGMRYRKDIGANLSDSSSEFHRSVEVTP